MTSICLLNFTSRKKRLENVVEYGSRRKFILEKPNALKVELQEWNVIYNFYLYVKFICQKFSKILLIEKYINAIVLQELSL